MECKEKEYMPLIFARFRNLVCKLLYFTGIIFSGSEKPIIPKLGKPINQFYFHQKSPMSALKMFGSPDKTQKHTTSKM
jgi:hypothetical protein